MFWCSTTEKIIYGIVIGIIIALFVFCICYMVNNYHNQTLITSGVVIDKLYSPARYYRTKNGGQYWPASYSIYVRGDNGIEASYEVTPEKYNEVHIDDWFANVAKELK